MARKIDTSNFDEAAVVELMGGAPSVRSVPASQLIVPAAAPSEPPVNVIKAAVPAPSQEECLSSVWEAEPTEAAADAGNEQNAQTMPVKRKGRGKSYDDLFLDNTPIRLRVGLAVEVEVLDKLSYIARVVFNNRVPMSVLVSNILVYRITSYALSKLEGDTFDISYSAKMSYKYTWQQNCIFIIIYIN